MQSSRKCGKIKTLPSLCLNIIPSARSLLDKAFIQNPKLPEPRYQRISAGIRTRLIFLTN
eukprot:snap_masked-scaffold_37-processed-gene-2.84-mRNA-1 protein AED:1.00 eAED:1.00 QI:0/0/0/0/1/1/2/0/59